MTSLEDELQKVREESKKTVSKGNNRLFNAKAINLELGRFAYRT